MTQFLTVRFIFYHDMNLLFIMLLTLCHNADSNGSFTNPENGVVTIVNGDIFYHS